VRIVLALQQTNDARIAAALVHRGHHVFEATTDVALAKPTSTHLSSGDLIVIDGELAKRADLVARIASESPGIEFVLVGPHRANHPDVIEQLDRPVDLDRLLAVVDELADVLDGERLREPTDLVAYETLFAGNSPQIRDLLRRVRIVARSDAPVWIVGDDGSGRAIIARATHDRSGRRAQPFVAYNTAAYSDEELSRLLFRGDGAAVHTSRGGSLFIERIGSAGPTTQRELIHYIEAGGRNGAGPRLIFGIQRDQTHEPPPFVSKELYYRLKILEVDIPPLRERARDLEEIVGRMLERLVSDGQVPEVSDKTMDLLERYSFPGNLLELAHALTHAFILARGGAILPEHLPLSIRQLVRDATPQTRALSDGELEALDVVAKRFERDYLLRVLRSVGGNRGRAADILGLTRKGLWGKLKTHGISDHDIEHEDTST
jgi:DNA-binding NtrC family response regulator